MEVWLPVEEFPGYEVSSHGRVRNDSTQRILGMYDNGGGTLQVVMRRERKNNARAVHKLVAEAFLDLPPEDHVPIHLDGNWLNNHVDNLQWKPRWFAFKRTRQLNRTRPRDPRPVLEVKTGRVYDNALVCAKEIGGLEELVISTAQSRTGATYLGSAYQFHRF